MINKWKMVSKRHMEHILKSSSNLYQKLKSTKPWTRMSSTIRLLSKLVRARANSMRSTAKCGRMRSKKLPISSKIRWKTSKMTRKRDCIARRLLIWEIFTIISIFKLGTDKSTPMTLMHVLRLMSKLWLKIRKRMRKLPRKLKMIKRQEL
jgi:hypothetical protein